MGTLKAIQESKTIKENFDFLQKQFVKTCESENKQKTDKGKFRNCPKLANITPVLSNLFESLVRKQLSKFFKGV